MTILIILMLVISIIGIVTNSLVLKAQKKAYKPFKNSERVKAFLNAYKQLNGFERFVCKEMLTKGAFDN